jgi:isopentenyl-diphosphate Delta-isomerase
MTEYVVLVNEKDEEVGLAEKLEAHEKGLLLRAVSVVLFQAENPGLTLLQQRAAVKYHSPLLWANACCSHPRREEASLAAAQRRVREELAIDPPPLEYAGSFLYHAPVGQLAEHEITHVFFGFLPKDAVIALNPSEVAAVEWADTQALPGGRAYAPWLRGVLDTALTARERMKVRA